MHIAIWIITALLLGFWTLLAWGVATVLAIDPAWVGDLRPLIEQIPYGHVLDLWVPGWAGMLRALLDATQLMLGWLGSSAGWLVCLLWGLGAAVLLGLGALCSGVMVLVRRSTAPPPGGGMVARPRP